MVLRSTDPLLDLDLGSVLRLVMVFSECEWQTALQLRRVSRGWYLAVSFTMFGSLIFTPSDSDETVVKVRSRNMRLLPPALRLIHPDCWSRWSPGYLFTAVTIVVSVVGFFPRTCNLHLLQKALPNLLVLRMCPDPVKTTFLPYVPFRAPATVFFAQVADEHGDTDPSRSKSLVKLPSTRPRMYNLVWMRATAQTLLPLKHPKQLSPRVKTVVINTFNLCQTINLSQMYNIPPVLPNHVEEVIIAVPYYVALEHGFTSRWKTATASANVASLLLLSSHATFTLVGLDEVRIENCEAQLRSLLFNDLWLLVKQRAQGSADGAESMEQIAVRYVKVTEIMSRLRMISLQDFIGQYCAGVSEVARSLLEVTCHCGVWFEDEVNEIKKNEARALRRFPNFSVVPDVGNSADRLFEYIAENGLF